MKRYKLADYISLGFSNCALKVGFGSIQYEFGEKKLFSKIINLCHFLILPRTEKEILHFLVTEEKIDSKISKKIITNFKLKHLLIEDTIQEKIYKTFDRYSRHLLFYNMYTSNPIFVQKKLAKAHVTLLGCGGIGNVVATMLSVAGIGQITLVDDDRIELSNLTRQILFDVEDIGRLKVEVLKSRLSLKNPDCQINTIVKNIISIEDLKDLPKSDLLVLSGDSKNIQYLVNEWSYQYHIPFINIGYIQDIAVWGPFVIPAKKTACYKCFSVHNISQKRQKDMIMMEKIDIINMRNKAPSFGPINMLAASMGILDIIKYLGNFGEISTIGKRAGIWTNEIKLQYQNYEKQDNCKICN
jgi:molybdopterin/thiamine biosynthesis adenylyltransferase